MKRKAILFFAILLFCSHHAESENYIDDEAELRSLLKELKNSPAEDERQLKTLNQLAFDYGYVQLDSAGLFADRALALAKRLNNRSELIKAYNTKTTNLLATNQFDEADELLKSAFDENRNPVDTAQLIITYNNQFIASYKESGNDSLRFGILKRAMQLSVLANDLYGKAWTNQNYESYFATINLDSAQKYIDLSMDLFNRMNDRKFLSSPLLTKGNRLMIMSKYDSSLIYLKKGLSVAIETGSDVNISSAYGVLGLIYHFGKADYPKAIENFLLCIRYAEKSGHKLLLAYNLNNLAMSLQQAGQFDQALYYLNKQIPISEALNDLYSLSGGYQEFGNVYLKQKKVKEALQQYRLAMNISLKMKRKDRISECSTMLGDAYNGLQQYDSAFYYFNKGMKICVEMKDSYNMINNMISMAKTLKNMPDQFIKGEIKTIVNASDKNSKAIQYAEEALQLLKASSEPNLKRDVFEVLSELYQAKNNIPKAYEYYKQYAIFKDSISNTENTKSIANLQFQYEDEKKEQQIALLNKDNELRQGEIGKEKSERNAFIGGSILLLLLIGITVNRYLVKQKANRQIEETLEHLKNTQEQLVQHGKLASLGQMTSDVAAQIQDPIAQVKTLAPVGENLVSEYEKATTEEQRNALLEKLKINLNRINLNGTTADKIVKDVLMQSRK